MNESEMLLNKLLGESKMRTNVAESRNATLLVEIECVLSRARNVRDESQEVVDSCLDMLQAGREGKPTHDALDEPPADDS